ncbi:MAG TPA: class I SAM-dependent methyltransferase [Burkholderiales bacterium]|nr:class I SAM-dependent methyltransferase [Burkholderiales bacterium]
MSEYDAGNWARVRRERAWERAGSLEEFLIGERTDMIVARVEGAPMRLPCRDYYRHRLGALGRLVMPHLEGAELVELGCGFGYNLFALALAFPGRRFLGLDISPNGIETGRAIAAHFGLADRIHFDFLDLTKAGDRNFALLRGRFCLTFFCLEQIPYSIEAVVRNIARAQPRRVLHVEPSIELLDLRRPGDWANYAFVKSMDYQSDLFRLLPRLAAAGELRVLEVGRADFAPTLQNTGFTAVWEPVLR